MKKVAPKKVTIDDLAGTIDSLAIMVSKGFDRVDQKFDEVKKDITEVKRDIIEVKENLAGTRRDVLEIGDRFTLKYEFHDIVSRVSLLEQRSKAKK